MSAKKNKPCPLLCLALVDRRSMKSGWIAVRPRSRWLGAWGFPKESIARRNVGVFAGGNFSDYELNNVRDVETIPSFLDGEVEEWSIKVCNVLVEEIASFWVEGTNLGPSSKWLVAHP
jgi:hypothetical protein